MGVSVRKALHSQHPLLLSQMLERSAARRLWQPQLPSIGHSICDNGDCLNFYRMLHKAGEVDAELYRSGNQCLVRLPLEQHGGYRMHGARKGSPGNIQLTCISMPHSQDAAPDSSDLI